MLMWEERMPSASSGFIGAESTRTPLLLLALVSVGSIFYLAMRASAWLGIPVSYVILWNSLSLIHFYLDGLIWAFKNPFVRQSIGPFLTPASHMAAE